MSTPTPTLLLHSSDESLARRVLDDPALRGGPLPRLARVDVNGTSVPEAGAVYVLATPELAAWFTTDNGAQLLDQLGDAQLEPDRRVVALDAGVRGEGGPGDLTPAFHTWVPVLGGHRPLRLHVPAGGSRGSRAAASTEDARLLDGGELLFAWEGEAGSRSTGTEAETYRDDDLVFLEWSDGTEEWLRADDYARLYPNGPMERVVDTRSSSATLVRGAIKRIPWSRISERLLDWLGDQAKDALEDLLGEFIEDRVLLATDRVVRLLAALLENGFAAKRAADGVMPPDDTVDGKLDADDFRGKRRPGTLYGVRPDGTLSASLPDAAHTPLLVFLHGTFLPTELGFAELLASTPMQLLRGVYGDQMVAFQHRQWSCSPLENTAELLRQLQAAGLLGEVAAPRPVVLISHSRGAQIGEVLCSRAPFGSRWVDHDAQAATTIADLRERLEVQRYVRCAGTVQGTSLMSDRLDRVASAIGWLLKAAAGSTVPALVPALEALDWIVQVLLKIVKRPQAVPGLASQNPDSRLVAWINGPVDATHHAPGELLVVSGNAQKVGKPVLTLASRAFFLGDNDFVVDTPHMRGGWPRTGSTWLCRRDGVTHGTYFLPNTDTGKAALGGLLLEDPKDLGFVRAPARKKGTDDSRSYLTMLPSMDDRVPKRLVPPGEPLGTVVLVPGIMGTHLQADNEPIWVHFGALLRGDVVKLRMANGDAVSTAGAIDAFYGDFARFLKKQGYRVFCFDYDWRLGFDVLGDQLRDAIDSLLTQHLRGRNNGPLHIVAHSMGGLVVRAWARHRVRPPGHANDLPADEALALTGGRILQAATPNLGAPRLLWMLADGEHSIVKLLNRVARWQRVDGVRDLRQILRRMPGVLEMLPRDRSASGPWFERSWWTRHRAVHPSPPGTCPGALELSEAHDAIRSLDADLSDKLAAKHWIYVAGHGTWTADGYLPSDHTFYERRDVGDGTVPWWSAGTTDLWYIDAEHDLVLTEADAFPGILDLLTHRQTACRAVQRTPPGSRGGSRSEGAPEERKGHRIALPTTPPTDEALHLALLGRLGDSPAEPSRARRVVVRVSVTHGTLAHARYPVVVGHHRGDGVHNTERALDRTLGGRLEALHRGPSYPADPGDSLLVYGPPGNLGVVVGLGELGSLTDERLQTAFRSGITQAACVPIPGERGISCVLVGSRTGVSRRGAVAALLQAIQDSNDELMQAGIAPIQDLEIIEIYGDTALHILQTVRTWLTHQASSTRSCSLRAHPTLRQVHGHRQSRTHSDAEAIWPHALGVEHEGGLLKFARRGQRARSERRAVRVNYDSLLRLITDHRVSTAESEDAERIRRILWERALPDAVRHWLRAGPPLQLDLDAAAAQLPWELLGGETSGRPLAVRTPVLRYLVVDQYRERVVTASGDRVVLLADLEADAPLPGASREAQALQALFAGRGWDIASQIGPSDDAERTVWEHLSSGARVVHIAAHGLVLDSAGKPVANDAPPDAGRAPVIGIGGQRDEDGVPSLRLTAGELANLSVLPEVVVLNTCHSGRLRLGGHTPPHGLAFAPDLASALIAAGVRVVLVTGWEVDDAAAATFAHTFWTTLLNGLRLADAILEARRRCFEAYPSKNTYGAYQLYGDANFRLVQRPPMLDVLSAAHARALAEERVGQTEGLLELESHLRPAWLEQGSLALKLAFAWRATATQAGRLRALQWGQLALTAPEEASMTALELLVETWDQLLRNGERAAVRDWAEHRLELSALDRGEPFALATWQPPAALAVQGDTPWRVETLNTRVKALWRPATVRTHLQWVAERLPTARRASLLGSAAKQQAALCSSWRDARAHLERARHHYVCSTLEDAAYGWYPKLVETALDIILDVAPERPALVEKLGKARSLARAAAQTGYTVQIDPEADLLLATFDVLQRGPRYGELSSAWEDALRRLIAVWNRHDIQPDKRESALDFQRFVVRMLRFRPSHRIGKAAAAAMLALLDAQET